jgi:glycosyltransferase involved in cell wall biosynthesis
MHFLILGTWPCYPSETGAKIRTFYLTRALAELGPVTFLCFREPGSQPVEIPNCAETITVPHEGGYNLGDFARTALAGAALTVEKYTRSAMKTELARVLARRTYTAAQMEGMHLADYVPVFRSLSPSTKLFNNWHNVESDLMARYAEAEKQPLRRWFARLTAPRIAAAEQRMLAGTHGQVVCSERDAGLLRRLNPDARCGVIDNGVDVAQFDGESASPTPFRILFVGSMDYHANIDAVLWFASEIWPRIAPRLPGRKFTIVGRRPPEAVRALASDSIEVTGTVPDVRPYYREAVLSVAPLRVGGGSRLKILESMAARVPMVSTTIGAEGLEIEAGKDYLRADDPAGFAEAVVGMAERDELRTSLALAGRKLVESRYDWSALGKKLQAFYLDVIR